MKEEQLNESILLSVREGLDSDSYYDNRLIMFINTVFATLSQLGVGPEDGFSISGTNETWNDFLSGTDNAKEIFNMVQTYMLLKVRLLFDPPQSSAVANAIAESAKEYEWRLKKESDY